MNILEQSCKTPRENKVSRVMILCDRDGFANMKEFLFVKLKDCTSYIDSITDKMEDFFVVSDVGDYFISCEDYVFYNIVNIIFCMQQSSTPLSKIPSVFYDIFINENCTKHVEQIRELGDNIDYQIMDGYLDGHSYEIIDNIDWYDVSEGTVREHLFVGAEIVTNSLLSSQLMRMFHRPLFCYDTNINNAYIMPEDLSEPGSSNYKEWLKLITSVNEVKEKFNNQGVSYSIVKACTPGCAAKELVVVTTLGEWYDFFKKVDSSRMITGADERKLIRLMAEYFLDYAYIESFKTLLNELIRTIDTQEELPF
jgi:hypothetical protein